MKRDADQISETLAEELMQLAADLCNNQITDARVSRLEQILNGNSAAQRIYNQYMMLHAELFWLEDPSVGPSSSSAGANSRIIPGLFPLTQGFGRWSSMLPIVLLGGLLLGWLANNYWRASTINQDPNSNLTAIQVDPEKKIEVARITGTLNCRWHASPIGDVVEFGSSLVAGQHLGLVEGVAEISFNNGARMILQAPAELDVSSAAESNLLHGRLTATCPPGAEGFRINTVGLDLIDLGTEFGVMADEEGNTEVHVFEGLVEGHYRDNDNGPIRKIRWKTNETARFDRSKNELSQLEKPNATFVRTLSSGLGPLSGGLLASEEFDYPPGPLGEQNGGFGWGGPWNDMSVQEGRPHSNAVSGGNLRYGILSGSGNHACLKGHFNRIRRVLSTSFGGVFDTAGYIEDQDGARLIGCEGKTLYIGFSQQIDQVNQVFYGVELHRGDGNRNRVLCVGHAAARGWKDGSVRSPNTDAGVTGWAVTSEYNGQNNSLLELGDLGPETTEVVFFVLKISFGPENVDTIEVFKNPKSLWDEEKCSPQVVGQGNFAFDRIGLANFDGTKDFEVDNLRIGSSFSAVTRPLWQSEQRDDSDGDETTK